jgi:hypothetical protein
MTMKATSKIRCTCGQIHAQKHWRRAWQHALADGRVISLRDESGSQIEIRSYPSREMLWNAVKNLPTDVSAHVVEAS